jgi:protein-disulfide isomerase
MIRPVRSCSLRLVCLVTLLFFVFPALRGSAEDQAQGDANAPVQSNALMFPKPDPAYFTAPAPTTETINAFLKNLWGYDENRVWQIQAVLKTRAEGVSKVIVFVGDKTGNNQSGVIELFVMPDGKHLLLASLGSDIAAFGKDPNSEIRAILQKYADGPSLGAKSKDLEIVELVDYQCPFCKLQHADLKKILADFPNAHYVFQPLPMTLIHAYSAMAAAYGYCVAQDAGNDAFFRYTDAVFENQSGFDSPVTGWKTLDDAANKAGLDPVKVSACAASPAAKAKIEAWGKLASDLAIHIPMISINGRLLPEGHVPYETLKQIIEYQMKLDGITK